MTQTMPLNRIQLPREERCSYRGAVRVALDFDPWRLVLTLRGLNLSRTGLCAQLPAGSGEGRRESLDAEVLLVEGDQYELQLDHDMAHLPSAMVTGRLVRRARTNSGWEMAFHFTDSDVSLLGLVHEMKQDAP